MGNPFQPLKDGAAKFQHKVGARIHNAGEHFRDAAGNVADRFEGAGERILDLLTVTAGDRDGDEKGHNHTFLEVPGQKDPPTISGEISAGNIKLGISVSIGDHGQTEEKGITNTITY